MRRLLDRARSTISRTNVLTMTLSLILGATAIYGFANQVVQDRDAAISRAVKGEQLLRQEFWREVREDLREIRGEVSKVREEIAQLRDRLPRPQ